MVKHTKHHSKNKLTSAQMYTSKKKKKNYRISGMSMFSFSLTLPLRWMQRKSKSKPKIFGKILETQERSATI